MYKAVPCPCGHIGCRDWHVSPGADIQGVSFTREQAEAVAEALIRLDEEGEPDPNRVRYEAMSNCFAKVSYQGRTYIIDVKGNLAKGIGARLLKAGKRATEMPKQHLMYAVPVSESSHKITESRLEEIERHGVFLKAQDLGGWKVSAMDEDLIRMDPKATWVTAAIESPEKPMVEVFSDWLEKLPMTSIGVIEQAFRDSEHWKQQEERADK